MRKLALLLKVLVPFAVVAAGVVGARLLIAMKPEIETAPPPVVAPFVRTVEVRAGDLRVDVETQGTVQPRTQSELVAEVSGRVVEVSPALSAGSFFEAGDVLVKIDPRDYQLALSQARLEVARAERVLAEEQVEAEMAREEWTALGRGEPTPLVLREPQVAEAQAALAAAQAAEERATRDLERTELRAPYDGRIRDEAVDIGQYVTLGARLGRIYAVDAAEVRLPIADAELAFLDVPLDPEPGAIGPRVELSADFAGERRVWEGRIVRTEGEIDPRTRMVVVVARVDDPYGRAFEDGRTPLPVGLFVDARIEGRVLRDVVELPREALHAGDHVYVVAPESRLEQRPVEVARATRERVLLRAGLAEGERVVVTPLEIATDGMLVRVEP